jgi:hypothetical protein
VLAYIYNADIYCDACGMDIKHTIRQEAKAAGKRLSDYVDLNDSDSWPQGPHGDGGGEADTPQHCGSGESCLNAEVFSDTNKVGCFLENPLTQQGVQYLLEMINDWDTKGTGNGEVIELWRNHYSEELGEN